MLGKLLKYEVKATARILLPLMAVLLVFAGVNRLISELSGNSMQAPQIISMILYITILVGFLVIAFVVMIQRFYKNLLTDEGYLMFTLPVKGRQHIISKLLVAVLWTVVCGIAALVSVLIIASDDILTPEVIQACMDGIKEFFVFFGASSVLFIGEIILTIITGLVANILAIYASIALGHLFNRHRILASLGAYILLNTLAQILILLFGYLTGNSIVSVEMNAVNQLYVMQNMFHYLMWFCIIISVLLTVIYFAITNYILNRRLNLE